MPSIEDLQRQIERLSARVRAAEDVQAIQRQKAYYAQLVDRRTPRRGTASQDEIDAVAREIAGLFTADGIWDGGAALGVARGREEIYERLRKPTLRFAWHFFVKPRIEVAGDDAHGTWDILSPCTTREGRAMWMAGVEHDTYVREAGVWLHASMRLEVIFMSPYDRGWVENATP